MRVKYAIISSVIILDLLTLSNLLWRLPILYYVGKNGQMMVLLSV